MIPLKLRLRNFMCYRGDPPPLDFSGIHVACLAGDNGHGKSALLDAITWALWGKSRASSDDDLIHLRENEMEVDLEFEVEGTRYRVVRRRVKRSSRSVAELEFQVWDGAQYRALTGATIRATEAAIEKVLRLDYQTFIHSAFLVQGQADLFTTKRPGERKEILARILGLDVYDQYAERARDLARACGESVRTVEGQIQAREDEIAREAEYREEERRAASEVATLSAQLREAEHRLDELRSRRQELTHLQDELNRLRPRARQAEAELQDLDRKIETLRATILELEAVLEQAEEIEAGYEAWRAASSEERAWQQKKLAQAELEAERARLQGDIRSAQARLESDLRAAEAEIARWSALAAQREARAQAVDAAREALQEVEQRLAQVTDLQAEDALLAEAIAQLRAENDLLRREMEDLKERLELLRVAEAACPLCGQPLGDAERDRLIAELQAQGEAKAEQYRQNDARARELDAQRKEVQSALARLRREAQAQAQRQRALAQAEQALREAEEAITALEAAERKATELRKRLEAEDYAAEARAALARIEEQISSIGYDPEAHRRCLEAVEDYAPFEARYRQLEQARSRLSAERRSLEEMQARRAAIERTLEEDRERCQALAAAVQELPGIEAALREQDRVVVDLSTREQEARLRLGAAQQKLASVARAIEEREQLRRELSRLRREMEAYEELREAFGKRGLQSLVIETVVPEIEEEANRLLARMTNGRMSVALLTQKGRKTRPDEGAIETLDIAIQDEVGQRPYELYSGGEAFRIDFALRIALSRLLARRAGTRLQTLFIDEGFGSQDAEGRQRLVEAIQSIQDDFRCILVITHVEELRDMFPVRIDVVKTPEGSRFSLS